MEEKVTTIMWFWILNQSVHRIRLSIITGLDYWNGLLAEEVRHGHVCYALMNIPRTKNHQYNNRKRCASKDHDGFRGGFRDAESVLPVRSNIACLCDLQIAFIWLLRAR